MTHDGITVTKTVVTPAMALEFLKQNDANRKPKPAKVEQYSRDMKQGRWVFDGSAIKFGRDDSGEEWLLDGQNRLMALVRSGTTQTFLVVRGLDPEDQAIMDSGTPRSVADNLHMEGTKARPTHLAATARLIWRIGLGSEKYSSSQEQATNQEILELIHTNPKIEASLIAVEGIGRVKLRVPVAATSYYFGLVQVPELTVEFFNKLISGANMREGDPALALQNRLMTDRSLVTNQQLYLTLRALNIARVGQTIKKAQLPAGRRIGGVEILREVKFLTNPNIGRVNLDEE